MYRKYVQRTLFKEFQAEETSILVQLDVLIMVYFNLQQTPPQQFVSVLLLLIKHI